MEATLPGLANVRVSAGLSVALAMESMMEKDDQGVGCIRAALISLPNYLADIKPLRL